MKTSIPVIRIMA